jgi:hypothetical protein
VRVKNEKAGTRPASLVKIKRLDQKVSHSSTAAVRGAALGFAALTARRVGAAVRAWT